MKAIEFHPDAEDEAREAANYYENLRAGLGTDFQSELDAAVTRIRTNPFMYAAESGNFRVCPLRRFPYSVVYEDLPDRVRIVAVAHQHHRTGYWAYRLTN